MGAARNEFVPVIAFAYALAAAAATPPPEPTPVQLAQMTITRRVVVRVPAMALAPPPKPVTWREIKGPKCLPMGQLAGAMVRKADAVDLVLRGGHRMRAELADRCPALDFYRGFYIMPTKDGQVCAKRDTIHSRAGGQCDIARFRQLVPGK